MFLKKTPCRLPTLLLAAALLSAMVLVSACGPAQGRPTPADKSAVNALMAEAQKDVEAKIAKDPSLKALAAKYPLVLLHSRSYATGGGYWQSAYSFVYETADGAKHQNDVQLLFGNGGYKGSFDINMTIDQSNLVADLGDVDFTKDPDPKAVDVNGEGQRTWLPGGGQAVEGDVYLERVRDREGNLFYVVFKVVAVDRDARYMAFLWRKLPGGKVVKAKEAPESSDKEK